MMQTRLDVLVCRKLCVSREYAKEVILGGKCTVDGVASMRPGAKFTDDADVQIDAERPSYVSRGGMKLAKALAEFGICLDGLRCLDIGASTGGFTDCMLQNGACSVIALDNGCAQLAPSLLEDSRVISMEGIDIRNVTLADLPYIPDFITCDLSFISLEKVIPTVSQLLKPEGRVVFLLKPQFECGPGQINKRGVVMDTKVHMAAIERVTAALSACKLTVEAACQSPITGQNGNIEYLIYAIHSPIK